MELLSLKLIVLTISGVIRLFFGLIPLILIRTITKQVSGKEGNRTVKYVISLLMFFGGGVLLATCFLHMMPEVRSSFESEQLKTGIPVPELIFIAGFFLVYLLEEVVHSIIHRRRRNKKKVLKSVSGTDKLQFQHKNEFFHVPVGGGGVTGTNDSMGSGTNGIALRDTKDSFGRHVGHNDLPGFIPRIRSPPSSSGSVNKLNALSFPNGTNLTEKSCGPNYCYIDPDWWKDTLQGNSQMNLVSGSVFNVATLHDIPLNNNGKGYTPSMPIGNKGQSSNDWSLSSLELKGNDESHGHSHIPHGINEDESVAGSIRNLLIVIAISFHGVFEGLAIGLQGTEKDVWALFLAVSLHECTILFCIGVELISAQTRVIRMITYITVVSLVSPVGIAIGIGISEKSIGGSMAHILLVGSLQGLAAGTLLYVTFFEIFAAEGRKLQNKFIHILVAIIGFVLMASLEFLGGHGHAHGHSNCLGAHNHTLAAGTHDHHPHDHSEHGDHDHIHGSEETSDYGHHDHEDHVH